MIYSVMANNKHYAARFMKTVNQEMIDKTHLSYAGLPLRKRSEGDVIAQHKKTFTINREGRDIVVLFTALFSKCGMNPAKTLLVESSI